MLDLLSHIEYLLQRHECVVVPNFGAFIVQHAGACFSEEGLLMPPSERLSFNVALTHDDGLLVHSVMRKEQVCYERAMSMISVEVREMEDTLASEGRLLFGSLGRFVLEGEEQVLRFIPAENTAWNALSFGLRPLALQLLEDDSLSAVQSGNEPVSQRHTAHRIRLRSVAKIAAMLVVAFVMGAILSNPMIESDKPDFASVVSTQSPSESNVSNAPRTADLENMVNKDVPASANVQNAAVSEASGMAAEEEQQPEYYLVVASFRSSRQAERYIKESPLEGLKILDRGNRLHLVYVAEGNSYAEVNKIWRTSSLIETNPDAWIYKP